MHRQDRLEKVPIRRVVLHRRDVVVHEIPLVQTPARRGCQGSHELLLVQSRRSPSDLDKVGQVLPFPESVETLQLAEGDGGFVKRRVGILCSLVPHLQRLLPSAELLVPQHVMRHLHIALGVLERSPRRVTLLQLLVDRDEIFDHRNRRVDKELELFVVERLGVGVECGGLW